MDEIRIDGGPVFGADAARLGRRILRESIQHDVAQVTILLRAKWSERQVAEWLTRPNALLDDAPPADALDANRLPAVIEAANVALRREGDADSTV